MLRKYPTTFFFFEIKISCKIPPRKKKMFGVENAKENVEAVNLKGKAKRFVFFKFHFFFFQNIINNCLCVRFV